MTVAIAPTHIVVLRDGSELRVASVDPQPGWIAVEAIRYGLEVDEEARTAWRVPLCLEERLIPASRVREVRRVAR